MQAISAKNVNKTYDDSGNVKHALKDFNLEVPEGSFFGLLGPNGAGKSTFINILAGLTLKSSGSIDIFGHNIDEFPRSTKQFMGIVPQEIVFDPFFTVKESLEIYADYFGVAKNARRTDEIIRNLGLVDKANEKPRKLSGGMKRRLLIAKALVHSPKILILDEPTAGVDIELRKQLWHYVKELNEAGTTIILTTHYLEEAETLCDEIAVINHGEIVKKDSKDNLMHMLDFKQVKIKFASQVLEIPANLLEIVDSARMLSENEMLVEYGSNKVSFDRILEIICKIPSPIVDIVTKEADLERVFSFLVN